MKTYKHINMKLFPNTQTNSPCPIEIRLGENPEFDTIYGVMRIERDKVYKGITEKYILIDNKDMLKLKIVVPESMKIFIPSDKKCVELPQFTIETIGNNLPSLKLLSIRAGWNQSDKDIKRLAAYAPDGIFVAKIVPSKYGESPIILGAAGVIPLGENHSWLSTVLVHPEVRRQGIAGELLLTCLNYTFNNGNIVNGLDATPEGRKVYSLWGYTDCCKIWRCRYRTHEFKNIRNDDPHVVLASTSDELNRILKYDEKKLFRRHKILRKLAQDSMVYFYSEKNKSVAGYIMVREGRILPFVGPFMADSDLIAKKLLAIASGELFKKGYSEASIDIPEQRFSAYTNDEVHINKTFSFHPIINCVTPVRCFIRMYHLVKNSQVPDFVKNFSEKYGKNKYKEFYKLFSYAAQNYTTTLNYIEKEKSTFEECVYGITGPEKG